MAPFEQVRHVFLVKRLENTNLISKVTQTADIRRILVETRRRDGYKSPENADILVFSRFLPVLQATSRRDFGRNCRQSFTFVNFDIKFGAGRCLVAKNTYLTSSNRAILNRVIFEKCQKRKKKRKYYSKINICNLQS